ncbi:hypothetical protein PT974_03425 [Cladobotryum mycophilum]|uniref:Uncharacterized protein n=1 Tax=Cladobotryum mycophilum TaxID=491253 RepID=A0ABR0SS92_9HYPO
MPSFLKQLISGSSNYFNPSSNMLCIRASTTSPGTMIVQPEGSPANAPPLFSMVPQGPADAMTRVLVFRGISDPYAGYNQNPPIGHADYASSSKPNELVVRGYKMTTKMDMSGNFKVKGGPGGDLKWKMNQLTGSSTLTLTDGAGNKLAKTKVKMGGFGNQRVEMLVTGDDFLVEVAVMSAYQTKMLNDRVESAAAEVIQAVGGM